MERKKKARNARGLKDVLTPFMDRKKKPSLGETAKDENRKKRRQARNARNLEETLKGASAPEKMRAKKTISRKMVLPKQQSLHSSQSQDIQVVRGRVKRHPDGFGFLIPEKRGIEDVYIPRHEMRGIMSHDIIDVSINKGRDDRLSGQVLEIVRRSTRNIVGRFQKLNKKFGILVDEEQSWGEDLKIPLDYSDGAQSNEIVAVEVTQFPDNERKLLGKVVSKFGFDFAAHQDIERVIIDHSLPRTFSKATEKWSRSLPKTVDPEEWAGREDLRKVALVTVDGQTAKDFDDAIFVEKNREGFRCIVAIADVSHYVPPESPVDKDAYDRGTSVYFPHFVSPMLPEVLSNNLCSLVPAQDRLCFACEFNVSRSGELGSFRFFEAVMHSAGRLTYADAQEVVEGETDHFDKVIVESILAAADLAKLSHGRRLEEGSLDLNISEPQIVVNAKGQVTDVMKSERLFAHQIIEELMLLTNVAAARFLKKNNLPGVFRVHDDPPSDALENLRRVLWNFGYTVDFKAGQFQKILSKVLRDFRQHPSGLALQMMVLRSMAQAAYSHKSTGHFGLNFKDYSHFTSPIRRYPDLLVHRIMKSKLYSHRYPLVETDESLSEKTVLLSACEQRGVKAERQLVSIKKARYMHERLGEEFDAIVTSVVRFGVFVTVEADAIDGLINLERLGGGKTEFDNESFTLQVGGTKFSLGQILRVRVESADIENGRVDFGLVGTSTSNESTSVDSKQLRPLGKEKKRVRRGEKKVNKSAGKNKRKSISKRRATK